MKIKYLVFVSIVFANGLLQAADHDVPTIKLVTENWDPNNYVNKQGEIVGTSTEKVKKILEKAGFNYSIALYPWARSYNLAKTTPYTGIYSIMKSKQREKQFRWVCPIGFQESLYIIRLAQRNDIVLNHLQDAKQYTIAVSRNEFDHQYLLEHNFIEGQHFQITTSDQINLRLLLSGHTDLLIATPLTILTSLKKMPAGTPQVVMELALNTEKDHPLCLGFNLETPQAVVDKLQQALDEVNDAEEPKIN